MKKLTHLLVFVVFFCGYCAGQGASQLSAINVEQSASQVITNFTITPKDTYKVALAWKSDIIDTDGFFAVERGVNGADFSTIGIIKGTPTGQMQFVDEAPTRGKVYYRIRLHTGQSVYYSGSVSAVIAGDLSCRFYPNPVDKALIVRSEFPVDLQIADQYGKPILVSRLGAGLKVVDVSTLEPGIYIITLFQKDNNRLITEKLVKK